MNFGVKVGETHSFRNVPLCAVFQAAEIRFRKTAQNTAFYVEIHEGQMVITGEAQTIPEREMCYILQVPEKDALKFDLFS